MESPANTAAEGRAEGPYVTAKTSVWWDIENCSVPKGFDSHSIAQNISSALVKMNYCGPVSISAYGDSNRIPPAVQHALSSTGISLNHVPAGIKDASDKRILVDMLFWAVDNPSPANYLLISGDRDFSNALHQLRMRRYNILLAQPEQASAALVAAAKVLWPWTSLLSGGLPLSSGDVFLFVSLSNRSNPAVLQGSVHNHLPKVHSVKSKPENDDTNNKPKFGSEGSNQLTSGFLSGGLPLGSGELSKSDSAAFQGVVHSSLLKVQPLNSKPVNSDANSNPKFVSKGLNQPTTRTSSMPVWVPKNKVKIKSASAKDFYAAPHEFFRKSEPPNPTNYFSANVKFSNSEQSENCDNSSNIQKRSSQCTRPQTSFAAPAKFSMPNSSNNASPPGVQEPDASIFSYQPPKNVPDIGTLSISGNNSNTSNPSIPDINCGGNLIPKSLGTPLLAMSHLPPHGAGNFDTSQPISCNMLSDRNPHVHEVPAMSFSKINPTTGIDGVQCYQLSSEFIQGAIGVILIALDSLKKDKIVPTAENIKDCIRYGNLEFQNTDVDRALGFALDQEMIMKTRIGVVELYVGRNEKVWNCLNPLGGNPSKYSDATWDEIKQFLTSSAGLSAITVSKCRYEAALILKSKCLKNYVLGEVLQILNMMITVKRWIIPCQSGWQPLVVTIAESSSDKSTDTSI
ncbi:hypothetical protein DCAR_0206437 [Daucus carota subsp. sativus]|uniref:NYN domain-containing protein n=1 Tax=Daucus carota subsp. sativus TaxID=79200 RepID=A0AAF0WCS5_DAUCS|nr:PREDICTED: uncharacterized protein LOC108207018 isoform X1 [Daucus carota subsp. sativus]WOG87214.1 hypothetical protein DCAR_0206437 [Daucus carota subsp. sativus]